MKRLLRALVPALALAPFSADASELLFSTGWSNYTTVQSELCGNPSLDYEAADDFDLVASVERIYVNGHNSCIATCSPPPVAGARVRFYAWTANGPGVQQAEYFVPAGAPGFAYDPNSIEDLDITLPQPFAASGRHYVSVRLEFASCFYWAYWIANKDNPIVGAAYQRTNGGPWVQVTAFSMASSDLSFSLYGTTGPAPAPLGCGTWTIEPSPNGVGMSETWLHDLAYLADDDIWAVGRTYGPATPGDWNQYTFAIHWDGSAWTIVPTPNPTAAPELTWCSLNAIAALAPDDIWAAGTCNIQDPGAGYVGTHNLVIHWDGSSWQRIDSPIPPSFGLQGVSGDSIHEILALAADDIWFFGEWITLNAQSFTFRYALAMHYDGSNFTVHDVPVVGSNGATIYAADAHSPNDIWAVGAAGDGDPGTTNFSYIYHWDGSNWSYVPAGTMPGTFHTLGDVAVLGPSDVWISGSSWAPPNVTTQFMIHWTGGGYQFVNVPYAGGDIVGEPPAMYVFGAGGASLFNGSSFTDAHLLEGFDSLTSFGLATVEPIGPCEMFAVGLTHVAGNANTLVARLSPIAWSDLGFAKPGVQGAPKLTGAGSLAAQSANRIDLAQGKPSSVALLFAGASTIHAPVLGGTFVPDPQVVVTLVTDFAGRFTIPFTLPASLPVASSLYFQCWIPDPAASFGVAASNAVRGDAN